MSIELVILSNHLILCHLLLLLPSIFPSIRVFSNESVLCIRWPKYWSFQHQSFRWIVRTDLLAVQGTLESSPTPQFKTINSLALSFLYGPTLTSIHGIQRYGKTISLTRRISVGKIMSLLCNLLSRLVMAFLLRSKRLLISWLQSPAAVILEPKKIKSVTVSIVSLSICHEVMGPDAMIFIFWMLSFKPTFSLSSRVSLVPLQFLP